MDMIFTYSTCKKHFSFTSYSSRQSVVKCHGNTEINFIFSRGSVLRYCWKAISRPTRIWCRLSCRRMTLRSTSPTSRRYACATLRSVWAQVRWLDVVNVVTLDMVTILKARGELIYELSDNCPVRYVVSLHQLLMLVQVAKKCAWWIFCLKIYLFSMGYVFRGWTRIFRLVGLKRIVRRNWVSVWGKTNFCSLLLMLNTKEIVVETLKLNILPKQWEIMKDTTKNPILSEPSRFVRIISMILFS